MKKILLSMLVLIGLTLFTANKADAQYVRVRPSFSVGIHVGPPSPPPYRDGVWVGPEWRWRHGRYVEVPGYWAHPHHRGAVWVPGHWEAYGRRGDRWVPGHWR